VKRDPFKEIFRLAVRLVGLFPAPARCGFRAGGFTGCGSDHEAKVAISQREIFSETGGNLLYEE